MWWRWRYEPAAYDDDLEDQPSQGWFFKWVLGLAIPAALLAYGIWIVATREGTFRADQQTLQLHGTSAIAFGIATISVGLFMHFHYLWGNIYNQAWFAVLGWIISACGFIAGAVILIVRVGLFGKT